MQSKNNQKHRHQKQSSNTHFPGATEHTPNQTTVAFKCGSTAAAGRSVSDYTCPSPSVIPVCALHTFTNGSKCHLTPMVPGPDTPATVRALTCPRARTHTHTHTHTRVHTHPRPSSAQEAGSDQANPASSQRSGWCREPRPPSPQTKLLAAARVPQNAEASAAPIWRGSFRALHRNGVTRAPEFK